MEAFALRALKKDVIIRSFIFTLSDTTSRFASLLVTLNSSAYIFWLCLFQILNPVLLALCLCRCVCAATGLCLPAVPKGQTDQAGVPDSLLLGSLSGCWSCFSLCHLSDIHRLVIY